MPKKSKKSKSKRMTLKQKYKIIKKVKEHHRKIRKEERKAAKNGTKKKKVVKDPGLPSQWPYKEELVKEFAFLRAKALADEKLKKEERKLARQAQDSAAMDADGGNPAQLLSLARLQASVANKQADFESRKRARLTQEFNSDQDNSRKAFYREFRRVVEAADVIIQVLDARDPVACRCADVERYIRQTNPNKKIILLLNKMDLVPREVGERWLKYFREELPTVAFKCSTQQQDRGLAQKRMPKGAAAGGGKGGGGKGGDAGSADPLAGSACLGAETLLQLLKNYTRNSGIKTAITVGVVGLPNVGKSSLINSLKRARVAQVGNTPGVTKAVQEVVLDKHIKLLDSPGVVFASAENDAAAALRNAIKVEKLSDPLTPVGEILKRVPAKQLMMLYKIQAFSSPDEFLHHIALARGKLRRGGTPDSAAAARIVLQDWNDGRIPYYTTPPERPKTGLEEAQVVTSYSAEFNADEVFANERSAVIAHLPSMEEDGGRAFFEAPTAGEARADLPQDMDADDAEEEDGEEEDKDGEAGPSGMEDDEGDLLMAAAAALKRREAAKAAAAAGAGAAQNAALYGEDGQFNPHAARAQKKRLKKARLSGEELPPPGAAAAKKAAAPHPYGGDSDDDGDFDFDAMNREEADAGGDESGEESEDGEEGSEDGEEDGMED
ncbi:hypothetical protein PLESTB_000992100 [Pleodorina starrii]|uniref:CP-type G domain-containing protein n=1 Tax=Pleodorina starrii TaxID=330485 RepID=A0A9W6F3T4_9CHLO|nr:hypothetical protein PLESTM_000555100 [Pleodorina starrii]GLC55483.1 hypothetical protein PLESTB_000992100 [Pleodorina starrii]GLC73878.1 hypothetical protein PLESTF_001430800 [Pleodorina starrii]